MNLLIEPRDAAKLAERTIAVVRSAQELSGFGETDPELAGECGVEICSLEARTILAGATPRRVIESAMNGARSGRPVGISISDLETVSRLEQVVSLGASRIHLRLASVDAEEAQAPLAQLGSLIGLATGAAGLLRGIF